MTLTVSKVITAAIATKDYKSPLSAVIIFLNIVYAFEDSAYRQ